MDRQGPFGKITLLRQGPHRQARALGTSASIEQGLMDEHKSVQIVQIVQSPVDRKETQEMHRKSKINSLQQEAKLACDGLDPTALFSRPQVLDPID